MDVQFVDENEIRSTIKEVRKDNSAVNWYQYLSTRTRFLEVFICVNRVAVTYENPRSAKLKLLGSGSGGTDELVATLTDDIG